MTTSDYFAILTIRQTAFENEADAASLVDRLAAELGIGQGVWERAEVTNLGAEGTNEAIRFPGISQIALQAAVDRSSSADEIARLFIVPAPSNF